jgi:RNA polymerase sigma-70 factor (ECF subfamily)
VASQPEFETWGTSSSLIERVRAQEPNAWSTLCEIYAPLVYGWARKSRLSEHDSEDIVQDVFGNVAQGIQKFQYGGPEDTFRGWLWTITRNSIRRRFNKLATDPAAAEGGTHAMQRIADAPDWVSDEAADEPELEISEEAAVLRRALKLVQNDFAEHIWQAFWEFTIEERSAKEVAEQFGMSESGVRQAKFRVLARLREALG